MLKRHTNQRGAALIETAITLPIILPAILAGWLLAFTLSWDDLVITSFVTGPGSSTLPLVIFSKVRLGVSPDINALATILVAIVAVGVVISGFVALTLTPMLCARILRVPKSHGRVYKALEAGLDPDGKYPSGGHSRHLRAYVLAFELLRDKVDPDTRAYWRARLEELVKLYRGEFL